MPKSRARKLFEGAAVAVGATYVGLLGLLFVLQRPMMYPRDPTRADVSQSGIRGMEEITLRTEDGEMVVAWHLPPRAPDRPVLVYFHGNAGNMARPERLHRLRALADEGLGLLAVSYRGYGGSTGGPTEAGLHADARAAHAEALRRYGAARLVAYGESLGTGVAVRLAAERPVAAVILESPYMSTAAVAERVYGLFPVRLVMLDQFRSDEIIGRLRVPALVLHGDQDVIIPVEQGEQLYGLAPEPKRLVLFLGGGHEDLHRRGATGEVRAFLTDIAAGRMTGQRVTRIPPRG
jgi:fermentation-respiration switch protein FrsA (DUF1100 family)